jgi:hypothetical protein
VDDPQFALDPDGAWYDEVMGGEVMEDHPAVDGPAPSSPPKKQVRSKLSVGLHFFWLKLASNLFLAPTSCRVERSSSPNLPGGTDSLGGAGGFSNGNTLFRLSD